MGPLVVLAYSCGLDTSAIVPWLREKYGARVLCFAADVGQGPDELTGLVEKAKRSGAVDCVVQDLREEFVRDFVFPTLRAGAVYARTYLLGTAMARPVMAAHHVALAQHVDAQALAHGCTGKGNDQVRFELTYAALAPELQVIAPWREWQFKGREDLIAYVKAKGVPVQATVEKPYSTDRNLWHCSHEGGILEDPAREPPDHIFVMTKDPLEAPDLPVVVEIGFEEGTPVSVNHVPMGPVELLESLNATAGEHGVGRADVVEDRLVGMKSRGVYETPGGTLLHAAHRELEQLVLDRRTLRLKDELALRYADLVYDGRWWTPEREALDAAVASTQKRLTGAVRLKLFKGGLTVAGRESPYALYQPSYATFGKDNVYDQKDAEGFIHLYGLSIRIASGLPAAPAPAPTPAPPPAHQMWGGRFSLGPSEALDALNRSLPVDHRLWPQDVAASKAWVHALGRVGVLTPGEETQLLEGLDRVAERLADGAAVGAPDEDVHTLVERLLYAEVGTVAGKLHTGRSRNDQVATDLRLWTLGAIDQLDSDLAALGRALVARAEDGVDILLPGYTHGQRAQPVRWAYVLLAHAWPLVRDRQRLADARRRVAELPLGSGALAGSGFAVDRVLLKEALGFRSVSANALDVTGDRDFVAEVLFAIALVGTHLSRLGAELIQYASSEYGFVRLADGFSTGSSLMPQKRNPDVFELARAKSGRLLGDLVALLTTLKGIPAGYSKDLQEDKALLFDAFDTLAVLLPAVTGALASLGVDAERMRAALDASLRATDLADLLVEAGVPFRESHALVGKLVREAERAGVPLDRVPQAVAGGIHPALGAALAQLGSWEDSVEGRATPGGASRKSVEHQLEELGKVFGAGAGT